MKRAFQSIGAVLAGMIFIVATHTGTDAVLKSLTVLPQDHLRVETGMILAVIGYRAVFSVIGCWIAARLAPDRPMRHALALGVVGLLACTAGAVVTADMNLGPAWYAWTLAAMTLPGAWLGGKWFELRSRSNPDLMLTREGEGT